MLSTNLFLSILLLCTINTLLPSQDSGHQTLCAIIHSTKNHLDAHPTESFATIDLQFAPEEHTIFGALKTKKIDYNLYGTLEGKETEIHDYIISLGNDHTTSELATKSIVRICTEVLQAFDTPFAWITLRGSHPNHQFDIPRWHTDGYFYPPFTGLQYKVIVTLQGPGTLLSHVTEETRKKYTEIDMQSRQDIQTRYPDISKQEQALQHSKESSPLFISLFPQEQIIQADLRQGILFTVGNQQGKATFHAKPPITTYRLFLSILPGTQEQIEYWRSRQV